MSEFLIIDEVLNKMYHKVHSVSSLYNNYSLNILRIF